MDEAAVNRRGFTPIKPQLDSIAPMKSKADLAPVVAHLQFEDLGGEILFGPGSFQDPDNSDQQIAAVDQGGLGLPDRDYYTKDDAKSKENPGTYVQHVQKIFELLGDIPAAQRRPTPDRHAHRDGAGESLSDAHRAARSLQDRCTR